MRSRATSVEGLERVEAADQHGAQAGGARHEDPVEQARDVGHRGRHQHGVGRAEPVDPRHQRGLPAQAPLRVQHGLGGAGRARGEEDQRHVGGPAGRSRPARARPPSVGLERGGVRERASGRGRGSRVGSIWASAAVDVGAPKECRTGAATAPMRQQARGRTAAARLLGTCQATASPAAHPPGVQAAGHPAPRGRSGRRARAESAPSTTSPPWALSSASRVGTVPGTAGPAVARGPARAPRWVGGGPSRQGTLPGPH